MTKKLIIKLFISIILLFTGIYYYMAIYKYNQMAVLEPVFEPELDFKRKYFDASQWLKQKDRYIKLDDFSLIDLKFTPADANELHNYISIIITLANIVRIHNGRYSDQFKELAQIASRYPKDQTFFNMFKGKISTEYLYTDFDKETLLPTVDMFLIRFEYENEIYEVKAQRRPTDHKEFIYDFFAFGFIYEYGEWNKSYYETMTYEKYKKEHPELFQ